MKDKIVRGRKLLVLLAGCLAGACWLAFFLAGLSSAALAAAGRVTVMSSGIPRTAILVQHRRLKQARRPAIVILRGAREKGGRLKRTFSFEEMARSSGAVLIYPEPLSGHWEISHGPETSRDAVFIRDLITKLITRGIADRDKVFLVGVRTGGMMALRLACEEKNVFAGVAVLGASLPSDLEASCKLAHPIPIMMVASVTDSVVPYHGGTATLPNGKVNLLSVDATLGLFGKAAGCAEGMTSSPLPDKDIHRGVRAYLDKLNNCTVPVEAIRIEGGAQPLPGLPGEAGAWRGLTIGDVTNARLVWDFLRPLGG
jgi:polyhydroxybutyrate depolymerase